jgi:V8-like Glu-specific endopeptidase
MAQAKSFGAYLVDRFIKSDTSVVPVESSTENSNVVNAEEYNLLIDLIDKSGLSNYEKFSLVCKSTYLEENKANPPSFAFEMAIEMFNLGYKNNRVQAESLKIIDGISASNISKTYIEEVERNAKGTFLACVGENTDLESFSKYKDEQGQFISTYFPFQKQYFAKSSIGTAFLVKVDNPAKPTRGLLVTAAHVVDEYNNMKNKNGNKDDLPLYFYQNFCIGTNGDIPELTSLPRFKYSKTVFRLGGATNDDFDWAIVEVEAVDGATFPEPLEFSKNKVVPIGSNTYCLGYPFGLPQKMSWDGLVFKSDNVTFNCKLLSYGGNSGSPVFDDNNALIGILKGTNIEEDSIDSDHFFFPLVYLFARYGALCHPVNTIQEIVRSYKF